jgi:HPt (histidine-containing phosphotransfer) domain-containing protein
LLRELVKMLLGECAGSLESLRQAVGAGDAVVVKRIGHTLRGSLSIFGAESACEAATRLEALGRSGDLTEAAETGAVLEREIQRLRPDLAAFVRQE